MSMEGAPPPPHFNAPANALSPFDGNDFETVVISSDGMETVPQPMSRTAGQSLSEQSQPQSQLPSSNGARFPEPGTTTSDEGQDYATQGMTRVATIHFANNASNLDSRDRSILGAVIQLQHERGGHVVVVGHASSRTRDMDYIAHQMVNFQISMERAASIGNALKGLGLPGESLEVQAVSDSAPLYMEVMPSGEAGNRRVEIYLTM
jgi:outer membrane protein OmpA-like peptidoglycan-associated protein